MQGKQSPGTVSANQSLYIADCSDLFSLNDCKPVRRPREISSQLSKKVFPETGAAEAVVKKSEEYRGIVGSLLCIFMQTTPALYPTVTQLSRFLESP